MKKIFIRIIISAIILIDLTAFYQCLPMFRSITELCLTLSIYYYNFHKFTVRNFWN